MRIEFKKLVDLIDKDAIDEVIDHLLEQSKRTMQGQSEDSLILIRARWKRLRKKRNMGVISEKDDLLEENKITASILDEARTLYSSDEVVEDDSKGDEKLETAADTFFEITKTALIVIELEKIKERFYNNEWEQRANTLNELRKYSDHNTPRLAEEVFSFLSGIAGITRTGMSPEVAYIVESLLFNFFPRFDSIDTREYEKFSFRCIQIGDNIFYDATVKMCDFKVASNGLQILKWMYEKAKDKGNKIVMDRVLRSYAELEETLKRPERTDLGLAQEVLQVFKDDLDNWGLFPNVIPNHILKIV